MTEGQRRLLVYALAIKRGHMTRDEAIAALGGPPPSSGSVAPSDATLRPVVPAGDPAALLSLLEKLAPPQRDAFSKELGDLAQDESGARAVVTAASLPGPIVDALWGERDVATIAVGSTSTRTSGSLRAVQRYTIRREHARGGMGRVLIALDNRLGREVALKELLKEDGSKGKSPSPYAAGHSSGGDQERFLREARITGLLEHPNIVPVYEIGEHDDGTVYYTMKFVKGRTLADRLREIQRDASLSPQKKLEARLPLLDPFIDACNAVAYAHSRGVVNRDLKPANVMLGEFGETLVLDWGLARVKGQEDRSGKEMLNATAMLSRNKLTPADSSQLTLDGAVMGTPSYMPPEQARGALEEIDEQSDVYSLGAVLYEILTGVAPYEGPNAGMILQAVLATEPMPATKREPGAPPELAEIARHAMAREKGKRLTSARKLAQEAQAWRDGRAVSLYRYTAVESVKRFVKHNPGLAAALAVAALTLAGGLGFSIHYARRADRESVAARQAEGEAKGALDIAANRAASERAAREQAEEDRRRADRESVAARRAESEANRAKAVAEELASSEKGAREQAEAALRRAEGQRLAAVILPHAEETPATALLVAIAAAERAPGLASNNALTAALTHLCERRKFYWHEDTMTCVRFSPDGTLLASGANDFTARLWDVASAREVHRLATHRRQVSGLEFSREGSRLLTWSADRTARVWNVATGAEIAVLRGHEAPLGGAAFSPDALRVLTWSADGTARVWTVATGECVVLGPHAGAVRAAAFHPDGRRVVTAGADGDARVWDGAAGRESARLAGHAKAVLAASFSPDGDRVLTGGEDGTLRLWTTADGRAVASVRPGERPVVAAFFHPDGTRVLSQLQSHAAQVWDASLEKRLRDFEPGWLLTPVRLSPDWSLSLCVEGFDGLVRDTVTSQPVARLRGHEYFVNDLAFSSDGRYVASASSDRTAAVWTSRSGEAIPRDDRWPDKRLTLRRPDGTRYLVNDPLRGRELVNPAGKVVASFGEDPWQGGVEPDISGRFWAALRDDGRVLRVFDWEDGRCVSEFTEPARWAEFRFAPDSSVLAARTADGAYAVLDPGAGRELSRCRPEKMPAYRFAIRPGGDLLAIGNSQQGTITLVDPKTGSTLRVLSRHTGMVLAVAFLDSRLLVSTAADASARVWDADAGKQVAYYRWPRIDDITPVTSPDGRYFAIAHGVVRILRADTAEEILTIPASRRPHTAAFTPDGARIVVRDRDGIFWDYPLDPLAAARAVVPRDIIPAEMAKFEVGTPEERAAASAAWRKRYPSGFHLRVMAGQAAERGELAEALRLGQESVDVLPTHPYGWYQLAGVHVQIAGRQTGEAAARAIDAAFAAMEKSCERGMLDLHNEQELSDLEPMKSDPRWKALVEKYAVKK